MAAAAANYADSVLPDVTSVPAVASTGVSLDPPRWLGIAEGEIGVKEIAGEQDNPRIVEYQQATTLKATDDETPWCASFVCWVLERAGVPSTRSARARSYEKWGTKLDQPYPGCVVVFWRGKTRRHSAGHVGFYVGGDPASGRIAVLGGNQGDMVKVSTYKTDRLIGFYWPEGRALPDAALSARAMAMDVGEAGANRWA